jgi:ABC-type proline/glycine betaine transport system permease subunit
MIREDPVSKAFRRLLEGAGREAATPPTGNRPMDVVSGALWVLVLALVGVGLFALLEGWLQPDD